MLKRIKMRTHDVDPRHSRVRDMMLTTNNRLTAEPAPEVVPGQFGVRYDGTGGIPQQLAVAARQIEEAGVLSAADLAALKAILEKYGSSRTTSRVGIAATDTSEAAAAVQQVRRGVDAVQSMNQANADFWDKKIAADDVRVFGR